MKTSKVFLAALLLLGNMAVASRALAADGIIEKEELSPETNYCHMKFPAITGQTLYTDHPVLKNDGSQDVIDFYGPCDESPTGKDQAWEQKLDRHFWLSAQ